MPNRAKIIGEQVGAVGEHNVPEAELLEAQQPGMLDQDLMCMSLHHPMLDPHVSNLLLAMVKAKLAVHKPLHGNFGDI